MPIYEIECQDGSDRNCHEYIEVSLPFFDLSDDQLKQIIEDCEVDLHPNQIPDHITYQKDEENLVTYQYEIDTTICPACGSDQTYDDEGNNISAV